MRKQLLIETPLTDTYQGCGFINAIVLASPNLANFVLNNYYNVACVDTDNMHLMLLQFPDLLWDDIEREGLAVAEPYHALDYTEEQISDVLKKQIDCGKYLAMYRVDEYYLSYTVHYLKDHFIHDLYIYGYDGDMFNVMAYKDRRLSLISVSDKEIAQAVSGAASKDDVASFSTIELRKDVVISVNIGKIIREIDNYLNNIRPDYNIEKMTYGEQTYDILIKCLKIADACTGDTEHEIDLRSVKAFVEHKKILLRNISILAEKYQLNRTSIEQLKEVNEIAHKLWVLALKYNFKAETGTMNKILAYITDIRQKERTVLECVKNDLMAVE